MGQSHVVRALVIGLLTNGHILLEGLPGTAKTRSVKSLANLLNTSFGRIQFTPDLLPSDVTGTEVYQELDGKPQLHFQPGPIFNSIVLADEVNRAPAKVQAAMLEAMAEKQVTAGRHTYALPELFLVMATQNPIEQEGTYPLPEAQLDRFLLHLEVDYPDAEHELAILRINRGEAKGECSIERPSLSQQDIFTARQEVLDIHMAEAIEQYIVRLVMATRQASEYDSELDKWLAMGVSPRATIALDRCARAHAWLAG
ncbi:AAA family ATPase, partial [Vibrio sp. 1069]|uniref:AAA family ATPase n=1 Tax=Vibrio sp. 1069 TaxID=3074541 RepID=UPI002964EFD1